MGQVVKFIDMPAIAEHLRLCECKIVMASAPCDPIHIGHIRYLQASKKLADYLFVIVNGNQFLERKKGYYLIDAIERAEIVAAIVGVDYVSVYNSDVQDVHECIKLIKPDIFTNGGDRSSDLTAPLCEIQACDEIRCQRVYGVGGTSKLNSSSEIINKILRQHPLSELERLAQKLKSTDINGV